MAIVTTPIVTIPRIVVGSGLPSFANVTLNASGDRLAFVIPVIKAGTLDWFEIRIGVVTNNPDNGIQFSFQDISLVTGDPDGTPDQFRNHTSALSSNTWLAPPGVMTDDGTNGGVKRTVAVGDLLGCVIDFVSFVASDAFQISTFSTPTGSYSQLAYVDDASTGSYSKNASQFPVMALKYSDGTYAEYGFPCWPILSTAANTFNTGSTPDERALRFQVPIDSRCIGGWLNVDLDNDAEVNLLDASNSVIGGPVTLDANQRSNSQGVPAEFFFAQRPTLLANTTYRLAFKPTSGSNIVTYELTVNSAGLMAAVPGGAQWYGSSRTDAGAWTDSTTTRPFAGLHFDGFDSTSVGGGGGGGYSRSRVVNR